MTNAINDLSSNISHAMGRLPFDAVLANSASYLLAFSILVCIGISFKYALSRTRFSSEFERFLNTSFPSPQEPINLRGEECLADFKARHGKAYVFSDNLFSSASKSFENAVMQNVRLGKRPDLEICDMEMFLNIDVSGPSHNEDRIRMSGEDSGCDLRYPHFQKITFTGAEHSSFLPVSIRGARVLRLVIEPSFRQPIYLHDCWIGSLEVRPGVPDNAAELSLRNSYIGSLQLGESGCSSLEIKGGGIKQLYCPPSNAKSPILKRLAVDAEAILHGKAKALRDEDTANYRNLAFHIKNCAAPFTQQIVNGAVARLERKGDVGFLKFINVCYWIFSKYNTRPGRPLLWTLGSFLFCVAITFSFDLATLSKGCPITLVQDPGWRGALCEAGLSGRVQRALALVFNVYLSPLSALSDTSIIRSKTLAFHVLLTALGLANIIWVTLSIFAVKSRFAGKAGT